jgi:hypothetical protein
MDEIVNTDYWSYYNSTLNVTATTLNGLLAIKNPKVTFKDVHPDFSVTVNFTARGKGNGSETINFEARLTPDHKGTTCMRTETENIITQVKINVPPMLTYGGVSPSSGSLKMDYRFEVTYSDADGDAPSFVVCTINGTNYNMTSLDGVLDSITTGEIYYLDMNGSTIGLGTNHEFNFSASDGKFLARGDTVIRMGPDIEFKDIPPICEIIYPTGGILSGELNITGTASDPDPGEDIISVEVSIGSVSFLMANGTNEWYILINLFTISDGVTSIRAWASNGDLLSMSNIVIVTIDNSFSNSPPGLNYNLTNNTVVGPFVYINGTISDPELPDQEVSVYVGLKPPPDLEANLMVNGKQGFWSIKLNLSEHNEGLIYIYAVAHDPYSSSTVKLLRVILDKPNIPPKITIDEIPQPVWGITEFSGNISDIDDYLLYVYISFDFYEWYPVTILEDRWRIVYNMSLFPEEELTFFIKAEDTENQVLLNRTILVEGPYEIPEILKFEPSSLFDIRKGDQILFWVTYQAKDHRGTTINWTMEPELSSFSFDWDMAEQTIPFDTVEEYTIIAIISNAENSSLSVSVLWKINVLPVLEISPLGPVEIETLVGEVILLQFEVTDGESDTVFWTENSASTEGDNYYTFLPEDEGTYEIRVRVFDEYDNIRSINYTITAEQPATSSNEISNNTSSDLGRSKPGSKLVIGIAGIVLIIIIIISILLVILTIKRSKKIPKPVPTYTPTPTPVGLATQIPRQIQPPGQAQNQYTSRTFSTTTGMAQPSTSHTASFTASQPSFTTKLTVYQQQYQQPSSYQQPYQATSTNVQAKSTPTKSPFATPVAKAPPKAQALPSQYRAQTTQQFTQSTQTTQPIQYRAPVQDPLNQNLPPTQTNYLPIPNFRSSPTKPCPNCNQNLQFYPDYNLYYCNSCQQYTNP